MIREFWVLMYYYTSQVPVHNIMPNDRKSIESTKRGFKIGFFVTSIFLFLYIGILKNFTLTIFKLTYISADLEAAITLLVSVSLNYLILKNKETFLPRFKNYSSAKKIVMAILGILFGLVGLVGLFIFGFSVGMRIRI